MILRITLSAIVAFTATVAVSQTNSFSHMPFGCLPPMEPYPYEPPRDDPELMAIVDEEYQTFLRDSEDYLNCLEQERARAFQRTNEILQRYVELFGEDARLRTVIEAPLN